MDVANPARPFIANQMGPPYEGNPQESSRELRVWRSQDILIVLHTNCGGATAHVCQTPSRSSFRYYDIRGENAVKPKLLGGDLPASGRATRARGSFARSDGGDEAWRSTFRRRRAERGDDRSRSADGLGSSGHAARAGASRGRAA